MTAYYGLTSQQRKRCDDVLIRAGQRRNSRPKAGWALYRYPSTANPPVIVRMRYRDEFGRLLIDADCSCDE
jgi:hypothetical protein